MAALPSEILIKIGENFIFDCILTALDETFAQLAALCIVYKKDLLK